MNLKQELRNSKLNIKVAANSANGEVSNVDIMRRVSQLEKMVYGIKNSNDSGRKE